MATDTPNQCAGSRRAWTCGGITHADVATTLGSTTPGSAQNGIVDQSACDVTILRPGRGWRALNLGEVWRYRELLCFLAVRDIKVRYKQTVLGAAWAIIQPLFTLVVFSVFFGNLGGIPSDGVPYPLLVLCALLPWQLFASTFTQASNSVVAEQRLITKVYFPRLIIPLASVLSALVDFAIALILLLAMLIYYGTAPGWAIMTLPLFMVLAVSTALAVGLWLAALNVQYRDFRHTIPFISQVWMFATPVAYPSSIVPERWRAVYGLNPMAGVVDGFRWALLGKPAAPGAMILVSVATVSLLLVGGLFYFRRMERSFADVV
jgi:lipopolysaccharide transport system permease protein